MKKPLAVGATVLIGTLACAFLIICSAGLSMNPEKWVIPRVRLSNLNQWQILPLSTRVALTIVRAFGWVWLLLLLCSLAVVTAFRIPLPSNARCRAVRWAGALQCVIGLLVLISILYCTKTVPMGGCIILVFIDGNSVAILALLVVLTCVPTQYLAIQYRKGLLRGGGQTRDGARPENGIPGT
jgi:hypothetical protein